MSFNPHVPWSYRLQPWGYGIRPQEIKVTWKASIGLSMTVTLTLV